MLAHAIEKSIDSTTYTPVAVPTGAVPVAVATPVPITVGAPPSGEFSTAPGAPGPTGELTVSSDVVPTGASEPGAPGAEPTGELPVASGVVPAGPSAPGAPGAEPTGESLVASGVVSAGASEPGAPGAEPAGESPGALGTPVGAPDGVTVITETTVTDGGHVQLDESPTGELARLEIGSGAAVVPDGGAW